MKSLYYKEQLAVARASQEDCFVVSHRKISCVSSRMDEEVTIHGSGSRESGRAAIVKALLHFLIAATDEHWRDLIQQIKIEDEKRGGHSIFGEIAK